MTSALLLSLIAAPLAGTPAVKMGPPLAQADLRVWLNSDGHFVRGDRAKVHVKSERDGYLVVLHADPEGRVRVLFPLDPTDDNYVRGGKTYEIRGRGDRDAFTVYAEGTGQVFAAFSPDPFGFGGLTLADHWDYRSEALRVGDDAEADLTELAGRMAGSSSFDYDLARYDVGERVAYRSSYHSHDSWYPSYGYYDPWYRPWHSGLYLSFSFGRPWYSSWYYDPWYDPYYYGYGPFAYGYYGPYYYGSWWSRPYYRSTVIYSSYYFGSRYAGRGYGIQGGRSFYTFKSPQQGVFGDGVVEPRRRYVQPPTDIVAPALAVPRVRDNGVGGSPADGRRVAPERLGARSSGPEAPRRVDRGEPAARRRGIVPADGAQPPSRRSDAQRSVREPSSAERRTLARPQSSERRGVSTAPSARVAPVRPEIREAPRAAPRAPERRAAPAPSRSASPSRHPASPSRAPQARSPRASTPAPRSAPRASAPSSPRSAPRSAPSRRRGG